MSLPDDHVCVRQFRNKSVFDSMATELIVQSLLVDNEGNCVVSCLRYKPECNEFLHILSGKRKIRDKNVAFLIFCLPSTDRLSSMLLYCNQFEFNRKVLNNLLHFTETMLLTDYLGSLACTAICRKKGCRAAEIRLNSHTKLECFLLNITGPIDTVAKGDSSVFLRGKWPMHDCFRQYKFHLKTFLLSYLLFVKPLPQKV